MRYVWDWANNNIKAMPFKDNNDDIMLWSASRLAWADGAMPRERLNAERHEIEIDFILHVFSV